MLPQATQPTLLPTFEERDIQVTVEEGIHNWHKKYTAEAVDVRSGISMKRKNRKKKDTAINDAKSMLKNALVKEGIIRCV